MTRAPPPTYAKLGETEASVTANVRIFLDTVPQRGCVEYDTKAGYIVRYAMEQGEGGRPKVKVNGDEVVFERVEGIVEVMWKDEP